jgi:hypothetical protein
MENLQAYIQQLNAIFKTETNRYKAHERCQPILVDMAKNKSILFEIIKKNLERPDFFLQNRINPVIALDIEVNETLSFVAHCWMPLPDKRNDITHQSIHHHGKLLLTSVAAFGSGYESIVFKKGYTIDKKTGYTSMEIEKIYKNPYLNIEFIDSHTPHIVFYPSEFSITYALWTNAAIATSENMKKIGFINKYKKQLRKLIDAFGAAKLLGLNTNEYLDFYPSNKKIIAMKSRVMYPAGNNKSFMQGFFSLLQTLEYNDVESLKKAMAALPEQAQAFANQLLLKYNATEKIDDAFEKIQLNIPYINFEKELLLQCF